MCSAINPSSLGCFNGTTTCAKHSSKTAEFPYEQARRVLPANTPVSGFARAIPLQTRRRGSKMNAFYSVTAALLVSLLYVSPAYAAPRPVQPTYRAPQSSSPPSTYTSRIVATPRVQSAPPPSTYTNHTEALQPVGTTRTERRVDAQPRSVGRADTTRIQTLLGPAPPANTNRIDGIRLDTARVNNQAQANRIDAIRSDLRRTDALNATVRPLDNLNTVNRQETTHAFDSSIARRETYEFEAFQKWLSEEEQASGPVRSEGEIIQLGPHGAASRNRSALGYSGSQIQSAHGAPQSIMKAVPGYNPRPVCEREEFTKCAPRR
jgi:hypothetical protein